jgi:hypothetical protein
VPILIPELGVAMTSGTVTEWFGRRRRILIEDLRPDEVIKERLAG